MGVHTPTVGDEFYIYIYYNILYIYIYIVFQKNPILRGRKCMEHLGFQRGLGPGNSLKTASPRYRIIGRSTWRCWCLNRGLEPGSWGVTKAGDFFTTGFLGRQKITCLLGEENHLKIKMEPTNIILNLKRKVIYLNRTLFRFFWFYACENVRGCKVTPLLRFFNEHPWKRWMKHLKPSSISHLGQTNLMVSQWGGAKFITLLIDTPKSSN